MLEEVHETLKLSGQNLLSGGLQRETMLPLIEIEGKREALWACVWGTFRTISATRKTIL